MPWAKEKPLGAYLSLYGQTLHAHAMQLTDPAGTAWTPMADVEDRTTAERMVIQGRCWGKAATRQGYHPVLREFKMCFRWRTAPWQGIWVEARLLSRKDALQDIVALALAGHGVGTGEGG